VAKAPLPLDLGHLRGAPAQQRQFGELGLEIQNRDHSALRSGPTDDTRYTHDSDRLYAARLVNTFGLDFTRGTRDREQAGRDGGRGRCELAGTLLKTGIFDEYREINGRTLATHLTLVDAIRKDKKSVLEFSDLRVRDLPEKYFNKNYMKTLD
jgi:Outer membrane lipoprotein-sorting protein